MMGASFCKPCVRYAGNCLQSSSSDAGGTYSLKMTDDTKHRGSSRISSRKTRNVYEFWNSWESIVSNGATTLNVNASKHSNRLLSNSAHLLLGKEPNGATENRKTFVKNILRRNLSFDPANYVFAKYTKEWNSECSLRTYEMNSEHFTSPQVGDNKSSKNSSLKVEFPSSDSIFNNFEIHRIDSISFSDSEASATFHHSHAEDLPSTFSLHERTSKGNFDRYSFGDSESSAMFQRSHVDVEDRPSAGHLRERTTRETFDTDSFENVEAVDETSTGLRKDADVIKSEIAQCSSSDSELTYRNSENTACTQASNVSKGAVGKIKRTVISSDEPRTLALPEPEELIETQPSSTFQNDTSNCSPEEEGKTLHDSKNMTAEVGFFNNSQRITYNHPLSGKDVPDNGTTFLNNLGVPALLATEKDRLKTFKNWSNKHIDPKKLAAAGFYYTGKTDIVVCYRCGIKGHNWVENDKPMEDHTRWNKNCPFVRENTTEHDNAQTRQQGRDICGNLGVEIFPYSETEDRTEPPESPNLEKLGIRKAKGPSHPDQIIYETRLATFENWPKSLKQKPAELASAGFYYLGIGDQTLCFYCGGGLKDWVEEDDPWEQHALWFPKCNYLLLKKTPAFVDSVQNKHKGFLSSKQDEPEEASCSTSVNAKEPPSAVILEREEKNSEESSTLCKICFKNELGVVFLPCGHMVACIDCASALKECAICRKGIQATVRAFLA